MLARRLPPSQVGASAHASRITTTEDDRPPPGAAADQELDAALAAGVPCRVSFSPALTPKQLAAVLGVSTSVLQTWRALGTGPKFVKFSRRTVRYLPSSVAAWLEAAAKG